MTDLSPQAQAVLDAFGRHPLHGDHVAESLVHGALPAALRAAADQVVPKEEVPSVMRLLELERLCQRQKTRARLLAIAAELRGQEAPMAEPTWKAWSDECPVCGCVLKVFTDDQRNQ